MNDPKQGGGRNEDPGPIQKQKLKEFGIDSRGVKPEIVAAVKFVAIPIAL
jgi:hypothetical protein